MAATQHTELPALCTPRSHESGSECTRFVLSEEVDVIDERVAKNGGVRWVHGWVAGSQECPVIKLFNSTKLPLEKG